MINDAGTSSSTRKTREKTEICIFQVKFCNLVIFVNLSLLMDFTSEASQKLWFLEGLTDEITSKQAKKEERKEGRNSQHKLKKEQRCWNLIQKKVEGG